MPPLRRSVAMGGEIVGAGCSASMGFDGCIHPGSERTSRFEPDKYDGA